MNRMTGVVPRKILSKQSGRIYDAAAAEFSRVRIENFDVSPAGRHAEPIIVMNFGREIANDK